MLTKHNWEVIMNCLVDVYSMLEMQDCGNPKCEAAQKAKQHLAEITETIEAVERDQGIEKVVSLNCVH